MEWSVARILIAEDDPLIRSMLEKGLRADGFSTYLVDDGEQAQQLALTQEFDLMILDMGLPEREGFDVLQELRARGKTLPILVLTGRRERDVVSCLEAGADDYMQKPFRFSELLARVHSRLRVKSELDRMERLVDGLRLLSEAEQPDFLRPERIALGPFVHELRDKASALASRRWEIDHAADGTLQADGRRLAQAVMNLARNAVQHTSEGDGIAVGAARRGDEVRIWVRDSGSGIAVSDQASILDADGRDPGGGLGLAVVRTIAEAHGGRVELKSKLGEGSTFTIVLPQQRGEGGVGGQDPDR
jgi:DNA-binding response OmpR family regulator